MTRTRAKYVIGLTAASLGIAAFAAAPASASDRHTWTRNCSDDRTYEAYVDDHKATTTRKSDGNCAGHAYVRIKVEGGGWGPWGSSTGTATKRSPVYKIVASQHKDCDCSSANIHTLTP